MLRDCTGIPDAIIIATGSEVGLAVEALKALNSNGYRVRVVSMPSIDRYEHQDTSYHEDVLPVSVTARVAIEAGTSRGWSRYVGTKGRVIGIDSFGESAPAGAVVEHFGFEVANVVSIVESVVEQKNDAVK